MTKIVRTFSACGPCITKGRLVKETAQFYIFEEWKGGNDYEGLRRISKEKAHIEPCHSCCDHAQTVYPNGYMD